MSLYDIVILIIFISGHDCDKLPNSRNGAHHPKGCPGAVWSDGSVAYQYCTNQDGKWGWWGECCEYRKKWIGTFFEGYYKEICMPKMRGIFGK